MTSADAMGVTREQAGDHRLTRTRLRINSAVCCDTSAKAVPTAPPGLTGVSDIQVFESAGLAVITHDPAVSVAQLVDAAAAMGISVEPQAPAEGGRPWWHRRELMALAAAALLLIVGLIVSHLGVSHVAGLSLDWTVVVVAGTYPLAEALRALAQRRVNIVVLLAVAAVGALVLGRVEQAAELVVVFSLGAVMEEFVSDRARGSIRALMALTPPEATRLTADGGSQQVPVEALAPGDVVLVRPGERVPSDGTVSEGHSWVDQSPVTGESMPVEATPGADVFGASVNAEGVLRVRVTKPYSDTVLARVIHQVEEARSHRGRSQRLADAFGAVYTPLMLLGAIAVALLGPLFGMSWSDAAYRGLVALSVSCSCALVISVPVTVIASIARGARDGILIKGGAALETIGAVDAIAFDKTGTLTSGHPSLTCVAAVGTTGETELLTLAAAIESASEHPVGRAIVRAAADRGLHVLPATDVIAQPGRGIRAMVQGRVLQAGRPAGVQLDDEAVARMVAEIEDAGATAVTLVDRSDTGPGAGDRGTVLGVLGVADALAPNAAEVVGQLRRLGIAHQTMLTGDNPKAAAAIAAAAGLDSWQAKLLPEDKTAAIADLKRSRRKVAMVGDGVNDAPAMATADVSIAMGAAGTDVALETADVALMADDLTVLPAAVRLARRALAIIRQNIVMSLISVGVLVVAALAGLLSLPEGILLNEGTALLIIANGLRMLRRSVPASGVAAAGTGHKSSSAGELPDPGRRQPVTRGRSRRRPWRGRARRAGLSGIVDRWHRISEASDPRSSFRG